MKELLFPSFLIVLCLLSSVFVDLHLENVWLLMDLEDNTYWTPTQRPTHEQTKNHYEQLNADWKVWEILRNPNNGCTTLGFNKKTNMFTAPNEWWPRMTAYLQWLQFLKYDTNMGVYNVTDNKSFPFKITGTHVIVPSMTLEID
ncbi:hypothetical protein U1Q18_026526 [Sarracenia purpurea var. burkii]